MNILNRTQSLLIAIVFCFVANAVHADNSNQAASANPRVAITTNFGVFELEVLPKLAPRTVSNFLQLVEDKFYDGLVFHRVIANFMIQGGGYTAALSYKSPPGNVPNESFNGVKNTAGTVAMARLSDPDSADTQFFINLRDNPHLDADGSKAGYTVFARVSAGMEVVRKIELVNTHLRAGMAAVPEDTVEIVKIERI